MYNLIMFGPPGAGKGTQAKIISKELGIPAISTGEMIRAAIKASTPMGIAAQKFTESGSLVPDDVVNGIVKERLANDDCKNGFILDGFPRTIPQAVALAEMGVEITKVISFEVSDEAIVDRMSGRRLCSACSASYHVKYAPPAVEGKCDTCGAELIIRKDDRADVVQSRLVTYHRETEPLKAFYDNLGLLAVVNGEGEVEKVSESALNALGVSLN
jgi:adenylate kinase